MTFTTSDTSVSAINFNTILSYGSISDIDENTYKTIKIGSQTWMAENLKTTKFNDGTPIALMTEITEWNSGISRYGWYNNDVASSKDVYGALYNWFTVNPAMKEYKNVCPAGWHVPGDTEWNFLTNYLGGNTSAGGKLKESGNSHWTGPNTGATNEAGFTALPGGYDKDGYGDFRNLGITGFWWSTSFNSTSDLPYCWLMYYDLGEANRNTEARLAGLYIRCVKDN